MLRTPFFLYLSVFAFSSACTSPQRTSSDSGGTNGSLGDGDNGTDGSGTDNDDIDIVPGDQNPTNTNDNCAGISLEAEGIPARPVDAIFVIDNSQSMEDEIAGVRANMNENLVQVLAEAGIDIRVIVVSWAGGASSSLGFCMDPPLGPSPCEFRSSGDGVEHSNPPDFFQFDQHIGSQNSLCRLHDTITGPPIPRDDGQTPSQDPLLQDGWLALLRPEAFKAFTIVTDDDYWGCGRPSDGLFQPFGNRESPFVSESETPSQIAQNFDAWLLETAPEHFGSTAQRKYAWHSIVGVADKGLEAYQPSEPIVDSKCPTAVDIEPDAFGHTYQYLSVLTGGLRYPVCNHENYDAVFQRIAQSAIAAATLPCTWELPSPPEGEEFDKDLVNASYTPGDGSGLVLLDSFDSAADCGSSEGWHYDDPVAPTSIITCPQTCSRLANDEAAQVDVELGCERRIATVK